jgi:hypothetical protein
MTGMPDAMHGRNGRTNGRGLSPTKVISQLGHTHARDTTIDPFPQVSAASSDQEAAP